jgi:Ca-activated chloride channel family protein
LAKTPRAQSPLADYAADELWVIYRPAREDRPGHDEQYPGTGTLMTRIEEREMPLPLKHTDVKASVTGYIASVDVTQQFENPYSEKIEAVYVFPLPENGAVNEFVMQIGARRIRGIVRERAEAERIYTEAKHQGYTASLLTQERPNIFTQSVANIEPGKRIDISIRYYNTLTYLDGWYEFVFPMVVGPRFNPPGSYRGIGAVPASGLARSSQPTGVHYSHPSTRSGHEISLQLDLNAGVRLEKFECKTHSIETQSADAPAGHVSVRLSSTDSIPNKDFVFSFRVAGRSLKTSLLTHTDHRGGFFTMMLYPPAGLETLERAPLELVFVLDCSGSMSGEPLKQAKAAIRWALNNMDSRDTFQLINFSVDARQFGREPIPATRHNLRRAIAYLDSLHSEGGTMMIEGVKAALDFPHDPDRLRFVCFLTDGFIGNESDILHAIDARLGDSRIFSFGVGSSVNRFLLDGMAKIGRGTVAYLGLNDDGAEVMQKFFERVSHPALTDVKIDWGNFRPTDVYPKRMPDLFVGRPLVITGRFDPDERNPNHVIQISGKAAGKRMRIPVSIKNSAFAESAPALPSIWARSKIAELLEQSQYDPSNRIAAHVRKTALDFQLLSPYTAFLALDASRRTAGDSAVTVPVAVPVPAGVRYGTTVSE